MFRRYVPDEIDPTRLIQEEQSAKLRRKRPGKDWTTGKEADTKATLHIDYRILSKHIT
jgi:hypothetical protein